MTCSHAFSRASRPLRVFARSFDWFTRFSESFAISVCYAVQGGSNFQVCQRFTHGDFRL